MIKRPMTTEELFNAICDIISEKGKMPDILDYKLATHKPNPIKTYEFDVVNSLLYGYNEGIYLDLYIRFEENNNIKIHDLGTFKTLNTDDESMLWFLLK